MPEITVIVAGANPAMRIKMVKMLESSPAFRVISHASDLPACYTAAEAMEPNVVLVARDLTQLPEFSLMRSLFRALSAHWIAVDHRGLGGALPMPHNGPESAGDHPAIDTAQPPEAIRAQIVAAVRRTMLRRDAPKAALVKPTGPLRAGKLILIGASTGGVDALLAVLTAMPADSPPIAVVQHTGQGFSDSLIRLLDRRCALTVMAAQNGMELRPGLVCVAAGCPGHLRLQSNNPYRIGVKPGPLVCGHLPSVDALFHSAVSMASNVVAALLTGMGRDGADGLLQLRKAGAITIGQDESSSVVYGMPRAAWEIGAVRHQLPLGEIAGALLRACVTVPQEGRMDS